MKRACPDKYCKLPLVEDQNWYDVNIISNQH